MREVSREIWEEAVLSLDREMGSLFVGREGTAAEALLLLNGREPDCGWLPSASAGLRGGLV